MHTSSVLQVIGTFREDQKSKYGNRVICPIESNASGVWIVIFLTWSKSLGLLTRVINFWDLCRPCLRTVLKWILGKNITLSPHFSHQKVLVLLLAA